MPDLTPHFKAGDVLRADTINAIISALDPDGFDVRCSGGLNARQGPGNSVQVSTIPRDALVGKVASMTAISGATPGAGSVEVWTLNPSTGALVDAGYTISVLNLGADIGAGLYVWIEEDANGNWWVRPPSATVYWCQFSGTVAAATGTWPSLTLGSATATVYVVSGGSLVSVGSATVYNTHAVSFAASKTTAVAPNGDGTFSIIDQDC